MVLKEELIKMFDDAIDLEESFLPEIGYLMNQKLLEYNLPSEKLSEAQELLNLLEEQSLNHYKLIKQAKERVLKGDKNEY